jgi:hypothetical protein
MQIIHERRRRQNQEKREQAVRDVAAKKKDREDRELLRQRHKKQMTKYTTKGQPLMNGRINRLLDKIKES